MAYQIDYGQLQQSKTKTHHGRKIALTGLFFGLFLWLVWGCWPKGREFLKMTLIPGNPDATIEAAQVFAQELSCGFSLDDAMENFIGAVVSHGYPG